MIQSISHLCLFILLCIWLTPIAKANTDMANIDATIGHSASITAPEISLELSYWLDTENTTQNITDPQALLNAMNQIAFQISEQPILRFGWVNYPVWIRLHLHNPSSSNMLYTTNLNFWPAKHVTAYETTQSSQGNSLHPLPLKTSFLTTPLQYPIAAHSSSTLFLQLSSTHPINVALHSTTDSTAVLSLQDIDWLDWMIPYQWLCIGLIGCGLVLWGQKHSLHHIRTNTLLQQRVAFSLYCLLMLGVGLSNMNHWPVIGDKVPEIWLVLGMILVYTTGFRHLHQQVSNSLFQTKKSRHICHAYMATISGLALLGHSLAISLLMLSIPCVLLFWVMHIQYDAFQKHWLQPLHTKKIPKATQTADTRFSLTPIDEYLSILLFSGLVILHLALYGFGSPNLVSSNDWFQSSHAISLVLLGIWQLLVTFKYHQTNKRLDSLGAFRNHHPLTPKSAQKSRGKPSSSLSNHSHVDSRHRQSSPLQYLASISNSFSSDIIHTISLTQKVDYRGQEFNLRTIGQTVLTVITPIANEHRTQLLYSIKPDTHYHLFGASNAIQHLLITLTTHSLKKSNYPSNTLTIRLETEALMDNRVQLIGSITDNLPSDPELNTSINQFLTGQQSTAPQQIAEYQHSFPALFDLKNIVNDLKGHLQLSTAIPNGTHYQISIPLEKKAASENDHRAIFSPLRDKKILLQTHHSEFGTIMSEQANSLDIPLSLTLSNHLTCENLEYTNQTDFQYDLIILDYAEPPKLLEQLLGRMQHLTSYSQTPIIILIPEYIKSPHLHNRPIDNPIFICTKPASFAQLGIMILQSLYPQQYSIPSLDSSTTRSAAIADSNPVKRKNIRLMR